MLKNRTRRSLLELMDTIGEYHDILEKSSETDALQYLSELREASSQIGEILAQELPEDHAAVQAINDYADITDVPAVSSASVSQIQVRLDSCLAKARDAIQCEPVSWRVAFFPYKVEMWDSLESIWRAMDARPEFDCVVVPIPYFTKDKEKDHWDDHYDGDRYPDDVPVTDWTRYNVEEDAPDAAFIHNPYDNFNHVVSVHPKYYSSELKKYVGKLFYVPYYVTSGFFSLTHMHLPVYENMDYMIAQSQHFCDVAAAEPYYNKMLPLGSPKVDRVIYRMKQPALIPPEWRDRLPEGKRSVMLNSSIHAFLDSGGLYMKKIRTIIDDIKAQNDIVLIWRPHPLLMATMKAMRPELVEKLNALIQEFEQNDNLIYDQTPDISRTVAIADAYIGESATSVINLFMAAGKPVFILNNSMHRSFTPEEKWKVGLNGLVRVNEKSFFTCWHGLYELNLNDKKAHLRGRVTDQHRMAGDLGVSAYNDGWLYPAPAAAHAPIRFHAETGKAENLFHENSDEQMEIVKTIACGKLIIYLRGSMKPDMTSPILVFDTENNTFNEINGPIEAMTHGSLPTVELVRGAAVLNDKLYVIGTYTNQVLEIDFFSGRFELKQPIWPEEERKEIDESRKAPLGYSCIAPYDNEIWLAETATGDLVKWNPENNETRVYPMPKFFKPRKSVNLRWIAHQCIAVTSGHIITCPGFANVSVCLDKETGEVRPAATEFWKSTEESHNGYEPEKDIAGWAVIIRDDNTVLLQRAYDAAVVTYNIDTDTYDDVEYYRLDDDAIRELTCSDDGTPFDGFEMTQKDTGYLCFERGNYSLEDFLSWLQSADLEAFAEKERKNLTWLTETLDGTCGEKTADAVEKILRNVGYKS